MKLYWRLLVPQPLLLPHSNSNETVLRLRSGKGIKRSMFDFLVLWVALASLFGFLLPRSLHRCGSLDRGRVALSEFWIAI